MPRTFKTSPDAARLVKYGVELAKHKAKIRAQRDEIDKLKRALRSRGAGVNLKKSNDHLLKTTEPGAAL